MGEESPVERSIRLRRGKKKVLRDYGEALPDSIVKQIDQAVHYFSNAVHVPAALIAGEASKVLFNSQKPASSAYLSETMRTVQGNSSRRGFIFIILYRLHLLLTSYCVCAELTAVLLCATAHSQILDIGRDEVALEPTALDLIIRHVEFEYVCVRILFFSGLMAYLLAFVARSAACLATGPRGSTSTGEREFLLWAAMALMFLSTLLWWGHVYMEEITSCGHADSIWHFMSRFFKLLRKRLLGSPLGAMSSLCAVAWMGLASRSVTMISGRLQSDSQDASPHGDHTEDISPGSRSSWQLTQ